MEALVIELAKFAVWLRGPNSPDTTRMKRLIIMKEYEFWGESVTQKLGDNVDAWRIHMEDKA